MTCPSIESSGLVQAMSDEDLIDFARNIHVSFDSEELIRVLCDRLEKQMITKEE